MSKARDIADLDTAELAGGAGSGLDADKLDGQQGAYYTAYADTAISNLVDSSPASLNTLNELAAALGDDVNFSTTVTDSIALKAPLASPTFTGTVTTAAISGTTGQFGTSLNVDGTATVDGLTVDGATGITVNGATSGNGKLSLVAYAGVQDAEAQILAARAAFSGTNSRLKFLTNNGTSFLTRVDINDNGDISFYEDTGTTPKFFWDASAESLGIGVSPTVPLTVNNQSDHSDVAIFHAGGGTPNRGLKISTFSNTNSNAGVELDAQYSTGAFKFSIGGSPKMTLTSGGDLLVGKTSSSFSVAGIGLRGTVADFTRDGAPAINVNRLTNDGEFIKFHKSDALVGSIGTVASRLFIGNDDVFLTFQGASDRIYPASSSGGGRDNAIDLGASGARFKDLYLSSGVYLGGTGAANKLDDYEEGTWSPTLTAVGGTTSASFTAIRNHYTKVGRLVTLTTYVYGINYSGITDGSYIVLGNFPFASDDNYGGTALAYANGNVDSLYLNSGQAYAYLCNDTNGNEFLQSGTAPTTNKFMATITYFAT